MSSVSIPVVSLCGSPFERGRQHGAVFADSIKASILEMYAHRPEPLLRLARLRAERSWALLPAHAPDVAAEICGIAEGSKCGMMDLYLLTGFEFFLKPAQTGCSAVATRAHAGALVGQNWDGPERSARGLALFLHVGQSGFERALLTSVGSLGWVGCNRDGLALVTNDLLLDRSGEGLPSQVVRRLVLEANDVPSALTVLDGLPHMAGRCYLLGDPSGAVAGVEISPKGGVRPIGGDRITHTNHALLPEISGMEDIDALYRIYPSSRARFEVLQRVAKDMATAADMIAVLRNNEGAPNAISKAISPDEATRTIFSAVFDCAARTLHLCAGEPAVGDYKVIDLSGRSDISSIRHMSVLF